MHELGRPLLLSHLRLLARIQIHCIWTSVALADVGAEEDEQIRLKALYRPAYAVRTAGIKPQSLGEVHPEFSCKSRLEHAKHLKGRGRPPSPHLTGEAKWEHKDWAANCSFHIETYVRVTIRIENVTCTSRIRVRKTQSIAVTPQILGVRA